MTESVADIYDTGVLCVFVDAKEAQLVEQENRKSPFQSNVDELRREQR
jgi:hypothetical protein